MARSLAEGKGYAWPNGDMTAHWPVGTSFIISLIYRLFGFSYFPVALLNAFIGTAIVGLSFVLAQRLFDAPKAVITGLLLATWPVLIEFTTILASELYFLFFTLLAFVLWTTERLGAVKRAALCGICLAAATYIRPIALLLPILLPFFDMAIGKEFRSRIPIAIGVAMVVVLAITPWSVRNTNLFGGFTLVSTNFGPVIWMGNNPDSNGQYMALPKNDFANELERDQYYRRLALDHILDEPLAFLKRAAIKVAYTHSRETIAVGWNPGLQSRAPTGVIVGLKWLSTVYWWMVLSMGLGGLALLIRARGKKGLFHPATMVWSYYTFAVAIILAQDRYHIPANPFIAMLAAHFLCWLRNTEGIQQFLSRWNSAPEAK